MAFSRHIVTWYSVIWLLHLLFYKKKKNQKKSANQLFNCLFYKSKITLPKNSPNQREKHFCPVAHLPLRKGISEEICSPQSVNSNLRIDLKTSQTFFFAPYRIFNFNIFISKNIHVYWYEFLWYYYEKLVPIISWKLTIPFRLHTKPCDNSKLSPLEMKANLWKMIY